MLVHENGLALIKRGRRVKVFEFIKKNISKLFNSKIRENVIDEENTCMKSETDEVKEIIVVRKQITPKQLLIRKLNRIIKETKSGRIRTKNVKRLGDISGK